MTIEINDEIRARLPHHTDRERAGLIACENIDRAVSKLVGRAELFRACARDWDGEDGADLRQFAKIIEEMDASIRAMVEGAEHFFAPDRPYADSDSLEDYLSDCREKADKLKAAAAEPPAVWSAKLDKFV